MFLIICLMTTIIQISYTTSEDVPVLAIPKGKLVGTYQKSYKGRTFSAFEGIPYSKPPVGDFRFKEPQPITGWNDTLFANTTYNCLSFLPIPMMWGAFGTEDCLYLYIYVPKEKIEGNENLDVVVHIHGGAFMMGSPSMMSRPDYIMDKDVVYVSFNYRLGILGFLSTQDDVVTGNNGLRDQVMALKWIKENIKHFGGNPDSVTITGLSAGAASVHYHYFSPLSEGLFHRGFSQSGTAIQHWALTKEPLQYAHAVAEKLNCSTNSSREMVDCFIKTPAKDLVEGITACFVLKDLVPFVPFGPVIEKGSSISFLSEHPYKLIKDGKVYDVPRITSNVKDEGVIPAGVFLALKALGDIDERWDELMPYALDIQHTVDKKNLPAMLKKLRSKYIGENPVTADNIYDLVKLFTDRLFYHDVESAVRIHAKVVKSPVYYYWFNYTMEMPFLIPFMEKGVAHSDDGRLIFPTAMSPDKLEQNDEAMVLMMTDFVASYAGRKDLNVNGIKWKHIDPLVEDIDYLRINGPNDVSMETIKELCDQQFWNSLPIMENQKVFP